MGQKKKISQKKSKAVVVSAEEVKSAKLEKLEKSVKLVRSVKSTRSSPRGFSVLKVDLDIELSLRLREKASAEGLTVKAAVEQALEKWI